MKDFKKYYVIPAPPEEVYLALVTPTTILLWSGYEAVMSEEKNSEFSLFEDSISGINLDFEPGKKIVQQWYFGEQEPASIVTIVLHTDKQGTSLELRHTNIPDQDYDNIVDGWNNYYIGALQEFYE